MILLLVVLYVVLGMFIDSIGVMILTLPVLTPMFVAMDLNMIWIGIIVIKLLEIGLLTPPVGLNIYVVKSSMGTGVKLQDIFRGAGWFILADFVTITLLILFPAIVLFLPELMR
jgi:TRAP-type C4-dicarboxylate transport system permease large subunit